MENCLPNLIGERFPIVAYVEPAIFLEIEAMRGDVSRSRFIGRMIKKALVENNI